MKKMLYVAGREFAATVTTKGFVFGILFTPLLLGVLMFLMPRIMMKAPPKIEGQVVVFDATGEVAPGLAAYLTPERFAERREKTRRDIEAATPAVFRRQTAASPAGDAVVKQSIDAALGTVPILQVVTLPGGGDVESAKAALKVMPMTRTLKRLRQKAAIFRSASTVLSTRRAKGRAGKV